MTSSSSPRTTAIKLGHVITERRHLPPPGARPPRSTPASWAPPPEALFPVWGMVRRQALDPAGAAPPTAELTDTDPAAIRWAAARMRAEWAARRHTTPVADMTGTQFCDAAGLTRRPPARIRRLRARRNRPAKPRPLPTVTTAWAQSMLIT